MLDEQKFQNLFENIIASGRQKSLAIAMFSTYGKTLKNQALQTMFDRLGRAYFLLKLVKQYQQTS